MTTTCQQIVDRAKAASTLNKPLVVDRVEMLTRILADQQAVFTDTSTVSRDFFKLQEPVTATLAPSLGGRMVDLETALSRPLDRVLKITQAPHTSTELNLVDESDFDAEYAPRYFMRGTIVRELPGGEWGAGVADTTLYVLYTYGPTAIDPAGDLTQLVSIPDTWVDLLALPLAAYLVNKDPGRPDAEYDRLKGEADAIKARWLTFVRKRGGDKVSRFDYPEVAR